MSPSGGRAVSDPSGVVLVDDDEQVLSLLESIFDSSSVSVLESFDDSSRALEFVRSNVEAIECVVSDYRMPGLDGIELLTDVRTVDPSLPFVFLTGEGSESVAAKAANRGVTRYLTKGLLARDHETLLSEIEGAIEDETRRKLLQRQTVFFDDVFDALGDDVIVTDVQGDLLYWNERLLETTGYTNEEIRALDIDGVVVGNDRDDFTEIVDEILDQGERSETFEIRTKDGETVPYEYSATILEDDGVPIGTCSVGRDVSERVRREQVLESLLRTARTLFGAETADEIASTAIDAAGDIVDDPRCSLYLDRDGALVSAGRERDRRNSIAEDGYSPSGDSAIARTYRSEELTVRTDFEDGSNGRDETVRSAIYVPLPSYGTLQIGSRSGHEFSLTDERLGEVLGRITTAALERVERESTLQNREQMLLTLHETSDEIIRATSPEDVCERIVDAADSILELPAAGVHLWNEETGALESVVATDDSIDLFGTVPAFEPGTGLAWKTFVSGETSLYRDVGTNAAAYNDETSIEEELIVPIGSYGVFISGSPGRNFFSELDVEFAELLVEKALAALERFDHERSLDEKERELERRQKQITRLDRMNDVVRTLNLELIESSNRSEIETTVCANLAAYEPLEFAWVGSCDEPGTLEPKQWSGAADRPDPIGDVCGTTPASAATSRTETVATPNVLRSEWDGEWRTWALGHGFHSCYAFPIVYRDISYGVLEVYATAPEALPPSEQAVIEELAIYVGNAINAVKRREALASGHNVEVELEIDTPDESICRLAASAGADLEIEGLVSGENRSWTAYCPYSDDVDAFERAIADQSDIARVESAPSNDREYVTVHLLEFETLDRLLDRVATVRSMTVQGAGITVTVTLPTTVGVRSFVEDCRSQFSSVRLTRQEAVEAESAIAYRQSILEQLTGRQIETIQTAYLNGYFEWPRDSTAEELAETMNVTPPTVHQHLRKGLETVVSSLFDQNTSLPTRVPDTESEDGVTGPN